MITQVRGVLPAKHRFAVSSSFSTIYYTKCFFFLANYAHSEYSEDSKFLSPERSIFLKMFIEILKAVLFGIVEGITEWLPVSSIL